MFLKKINYPEIMDDFSIQDERIDIALNELKLINKFLGGISTTKFGLNFLLKKNQNLSTLKILDVGSGASDVLISLIDNNQKIISLDLNKRVCNYLKNNLNISEIVCTDVKSLPFKQKEFDFIHASLFLHHFNEKEITEILSNLLTLTRFGIIINDLRRSTLAFWGIKVLTFLFSKSIMVKNDAPLSVRKGFTKSELKIILNCLKCQYIIRRKWAFRWSIVLMPDDLNNG